MISDLRLHGSIGPVEFFVTVGGAGDFNSYFYEELPSGIRFFSKGNEFTITAEGIHFKGTGGNFCEYMFGVEKPFKDMMKKGIANRLVMFGAYQNEDERITFTNTVEGRESFPRLFLQGHAVKNYYFLVSSDFSGEYRRRQRQILGTVGKFLKRTSLIAQDMDTQLLAGFLTALSEKNSTVYVFKLVHKANRQFYDSFNEFYSGKRCLTEEEEKFLEEIAMRYEIDRYQQERMKIDIMYGHPENRRVVDEYRDILLSAESDALKAGEFARLRRLKTLAIRNNIPIALFETLDDLLSAGKMEETEEPEYLKETNSILQSLFFKDTSLKRHIIREDIVRLIKAKRAAEAMGDKSFEQILLDTVRTCDEMARETNDFGIFEEFTSIVTYFDRYDNVSAVLNQIAFMENASLTEDLLRSLIGNKKEFDALDRGLFEEIFTKELVDNKYITAYGRKKILALTKGIKKINAGDASLRDVATELKSVADEENLYRLVRASLKDRMRTFFPGLGTKKGREKIREEIGRELAGNGEATEIPKRLFEKIFVDLGKESFYLNHLLPAIIRKKDAALREDFLRNSGLDRFYIEGIEKEYCESRKIITVEDLFSGGGERI